MARRDLSGNAYQLTGERAAIEAVARRYRIPFWQAEMALATDPSLLNGIINDAIQRSRAGGGPLSATVTPAGAAPVVTGPSTGWRDYGPLQSPPGQDHIERIVNAHLGQVGGQRPKQAAPEKEATAKERK